VVQYLTVGYFVTVTGMQCATLNHPMHQMWRMRHRVATLAYQTLSWNRSGEVNCKQGY